MARKQTKRYKSLIRGKRLNINVSVQERYTAPILKLLQKMQNDVGRQLTELFDAKHATEHFEAMLNPREIVGMDASVSSQTRILINALKRRYDQLFGKLAMGLTPAMADNVNRSSATSVSDSVADMPNLKDEGAKLTLSIKKLDMPTLNLLKASSANAASFITSIPETYLNKVATATYNSIATGAGMKDLIPFLEKHDNQTKNWVKNTAMDQTRKVFNGLNLGRMKKIGIEKGEWLHSGGSQHPRELHEEFDGETFDLNIGAPVGDDGGNNVMPGEEPNCRCTFAPVVVFDDDE